MTIYFSKNTGGFYDTEFATYSLPEDVVEVSEKLRADLLLGQESGEGTIGSDASGNPVLVPVVETLANAQSVKMSELDQAYKENSEKAVAFTTEKGVKNTYDADPSSVSKFSQMLLAFEAAKKTPDGFYWVAADNTRVPMTYADLQGLAHAIGVSDFSLFDKWQQLKARVHAAKTVQEVEAIAWSQAS